MSYSIGQVARLAGVTVRTLHHYDDIGLLVPSGRTSAGYRTYDHTDLQRLQRVLMYRELELSLEDIADLLDGDADPIDHLQRQHTHITQRIERLRRLLETLERTMAANKSGVSLTPEEMLEVFGDFDPGQYAAEAEERWGGTDTWRESRRRAAAYTKDDWQRITGEAEATTSAFAAAMRAAAPADSDAVMDLAEDHRRHITRWFYDCSYEMHRGLAEMYTADPRFAATYDKVAPGLAAFIRDAILANADRTAAA